MTAMKPVRRKHVPKKDLRKQLEEKIEALMHEFRDSVDTKKLKKHIRKAGKILSDGIHHPIDTVKQLLGEVPMPAKKAAKKSTKKGAKKKTTAKKAATAKKTAKK